MNLREMSERIMQLEEELSELKTTLVNFRTVEPLYYNVNMGQGIEVIYDPEPSQGPFVRIQDGTNYNGYYDAIILQRDNAGQQWNGVKMAPSTDPDFQVAVWVLDLSGSTSLTALDEYVATYAGVEVGGPYWLAKVYNKSIVPPDAKTWVQVVGGLTPVAWDNTTPYVVGNLVIHSGLTYVCVLGNTNHTPPNLTYWLPILAVNFKGSYGGSLGEYFTGDVVQVPRALMVINSGNGSTGSGTISTDSGFATGPDYGLTTSDGTIVTSASGVTVQLGTVDADVAQRGVVNITNQHFGGHKFFDSQYVTLGYYPVSGDPVNIIELNAIPAGGIFGSTNPWLFYGQATSGLSGFAYWVTESFHYQFNTGSPLTNVGGAVSRKEVSTADIDPEANKKTALDLVTWGYSYDDIPNAPEIYGGALVLWGNGGSDGLQWPNIGVGIMGGDAVFGATGTDPVGNGFQSGLCWQIGTGSAIKSVSGNSGSVTPSGGAITISSSLTGVSVTGSGSTLVLDGILGNDDGGTGSDLSATGPGILSQATTGAAATIVSQVPTSMGGTNLDASAATAGQAPLITSTGVFSMLPIVSTGSGAPGSLVVGQAYWDDTNLALYFG